MKDTHRNLLMFPSPLVGSVWMLRHEERERRETDVGEYISSLFSAQELERSWKGREWRGDMAGSKEKERKKERKKE